MGFSGRVYLITNLVNGKRYVGQTIRSLKIRWQHHVADARSITKRKHSLVAQAIACYGKGNFTITELETGFADRNALDQGEARWIAELKTMVRDGSYNLREGGRSSRLSDEGRARLSASFSQQERVARSERLKLRWQDPRFRAAMQEAHTGLHHSEETIVKQKTSAHRPESLEQNRLHMEQLRQDPVFLARMQQGQLSARLNGTAGESLRRFSRSDEERAHRSQRMLAKWATPEYREQFRASHIGLTHSLGVRARMRISRLRHLATKAAAGAHEAPGHPLPASAKA